MNINIDGHELELSVVGGALIIVQEGALRGTISLLDFPVAPEPVVLQADE